MKIYDVIVIGAGIQGAAVAQAAAAQGWRVCVLERNPAPGLETSSASSKLIHGGLRYLETLQFHLVKECLQERRRLLKNAPQLVHISPFYIPVYKTSRRSHWWVFLGLSLYAILGGLHPHNRFRKIAKKHWPKLEIAQEGLTAVYQYYDAQTDDRLLTEGVLASAKANGADVCFDSEINSISKQQVLEATAGDRIYKTRCLVNAAGPWVNEVAQQCERLPTRQLDWVQGTHLVLPRSGLAGCYYFESIADNRPMFVLPWRENILVGTTEQVLTEPKAKATEAEVMYLLESFNHHFPSLACQRDEVQEVMAGVRVLPKSAANANQRDRDTVLLHKQWDECGYVGIYGGKLTAHRAMAEKVITLLGKTLGPVEPGLTRNMPLSTDAADLG